MIEYQRAFALFDHDQDGLMTSKELSLLIRSLEYNPTDNEIQYLINHSIDKSLFRYRTYIKLNHSFALCRG